MSRPTPAASGLLRVATIAPELRVADVGFNARAIHAALRSAASVGASIALFPELSLTGYTCGDLFAQTLLLARAREAASGKDVRLGGGVTTVREFLDADLVDTMHIAVSPVELGRGERLWETPEELLDRFHLEKVPSPSSGVVHHLFWRR